MDGDGQEYARESDEERTLMRRAAAESIVLLKKNDNGILPLQSSSLKKVAILGGNSKALVLSGGGSASLKLSYFVSPFDGIVSTLPKDVEVAHSEGARGEHHNLVATPKVLCSVSIYDVAFP